MKNLIPYDLFEMARYSVDDILESVKKVYRSISSLEALRDIDSLKNNFLEKFDGQRFTNLIRSTHYTPLSNKYARDSNIDSFSNRAHTNIVKGIAAKDIADRDGNTHEYRMIRNSTIDWNIPILEITDRNGLFIIKVEIVFSTDSFMLYIVDVEDHNRGTYYKYPYANIYSEEELWKSIFKKIKGYERIDIR